MSKTFDDHHHCCEITKAVFHLISPTLTKPRDKVKQAVRYIPVFSCSTYKNFKDKIPFLYKNFENKIEDTKEDTREMVKQAVRYIPTFSCSITFQEL